MPNSLVVRSRFHAAAVVAGILLISLLALPWQAAAIWLARVTGRVEWADFGPFWYHRCACRILGLKVRVIGAPSRRRPTLFVANHVSWADIPVLGSLGRLSFVARADLAGWGAFAVLANAQRTIYIERDRKASVGDQRDRMTARLAQRDNLVLFAEGTSTEGASVLPFKSTLFAAVTSAASHLPPVTVQPVSVSYVRVNNIPMTRRMRPSIAWVGDMDLPPHFWDFVRLGRVEVTVEFHEPITLDGTQNRKGLAALCHQRVLAGVLRARSESGIK